MRFRKSLSWFDSYKDCCDGCTTSHEFWQNVNCTESDTSGKWKIQPNVLFTAPSSGDSSGMVDQTQLQHTDSGRVRARAIAGTANSRVLLLYRSWRNGESSTLPSNRLSHSNWPYEKNYSYFWTMHALKISHHVSRKSVSYSSSSKE